MGMLFDGGRKPVVRCRPGRVKQEFRKHSDIKEIVARYRRTGMLDNLSKAQPVFADATVFGDFPTLVAQVRSANEAFEMLPSNIRTRFHNSPSELIAFCQDSSNRPEAIKLGIIPPDPVVEPAKPADPPK